MNPKILGIVNITKDSFSDGGNYLNPEKAITHAKKLIEDGAYAVDLGPASSHPDAETVSSEEEIARLAPVITELKKDNINLSIDSPLSETQRYGINENVSFLNDINGFSDPGVLVCLAQSDSHLITMFSIQSGHKAIRQETDPEEVFSQILHFFEEKLKTFDKAGIDKNRVIIDPGMGFFLGSNPESSLRVLRGIKELKTAFECPVLISVSRKSFLQKLSGKDMSNVGAATLAAELFAVSQGVDYIRTHDVKGLCDALCVYNKLH